VEIAVKRRLLLLSVSLVFALRATAPAQEAPPASPRPIPWVLKFEDASERAKRADVPIFVYVYVTNHAACIKFEREVLTDRRLRSLASFFVMVKLEANVQAKEVARFEVRRYPTIVLLGSTGKTLKMLDSEMTPARVTNHMARNMLTSLYTSAKRAKDEGHVYRARRRFKTLSVIAKGTPPAAWAARELRKIDDEAGTMLAEAVAALKKEDYLTTMARLDVLIREYAGTPAYPDAATLMDELLTQPKAIAALQEVKHREASALMLKLARAHEAEGRPDDALITYWDIVRDYAGTPAADDAAGRATEMIEDRRLATRAAKTRMIRDTTQWRQMAVAYELNRRPDRALEYYQRIIEYYGETSYAKKAKKDVDRLLGLKPEE
jgi:tetratricopeptide (TPR) repeat protein